jgi:hypothetical protein
MNGEQVGQTPILGREGLLRLVEVVERLRARARGEEGGSWTTGEDLAPQWATKQCWVGCREANRRAAVRWLAVLASRGDGSPGARSRRGGDRCRDPAGEGGRP